MRSILVIGLGRFGKHLALKLAELKNDVVVIDTDRQVIEDIAPYVYNAKIGDCTRLETLKSLGIKNFDMCFVCMGNNFQSSLQITDLLKTLGANRVISKAGTDIHAKFLAKNGADEIVYPERDQAEELAVRYSAANVYDFVELSKNMGMYEIPIYPEWAGKSIIDLDIRKKFKINVLVIKKPDGDIFMPEASYIFDEADHIFVLGDHSDIEKFEKKRKIR